MAGPIFTTNTALHVAESLPCQSLTEAHLGGSVSRVVLGEEDLAETSFPEQLVLKNNHLVLGNLDLVQLPLPPCFA